MSLENAVSYLLEKVGEITAIKVAHDYPPEASNAFPFAVAYPASGEVNIEFADEYRGLHTINLEIHFNRSNLPKATETLTPVVKSIYEAIIDDITLGGYVDTVVATESQKLQYTTIAGEYGDIPVLILQFGVVIKLRDIYERYEPTVMAYDPLAWLRMQETTGNIADNSAYTEELGSELLNNADFDTWASDNPVGWLVNESPPNSEVSEVSPSVMSFVSDGTLLQIEQNAHVVGKTYQLEFYISTYNSGEIFMRGAWFRMSSAGLHSTKWISDATAFDIEDYGACDVEIDYVSSKLEGERDGFIFGCVVGQEGLRGDNEAFSCDGVNDTIFIEDTELDGVEQFTIMALCKAESLGNNDSGRVCSKDGEFVFGLNASSQLLFQRIYSTDYAEAISSDTITLDEWITVAAVISSDKIPKIYLNGIEVGYNTQTTGVGDVVSAATPIYIGNRDTLVYAWDGLFDEFVMIPSALSNGEISTLSYLMKAR